MAELRKMGVRLTAEGVNQYKEDLRSAGREARLMSQETRLSMAELGNSASYTEQLTTRMKGLSKQYEVDQNRVKTLTNSQKEFNTSLNLVGREIQSTSTKLKDSQKETLRLENNYRKMGESLGYNAEETKKAKAEWEASKSKTKELAQSLNQLEKEQTQYTRELEKMPGQINSAKISMQEKANEIARLREEYIKSGGELGTFADNIQKTSEKVRTFSEGVAQTGDWMTTHITAPSIAAGTAISMMARTVEKGFSQIAKKSGATGDELEKLKQNFRNVFEDVPDNAEEVGNAIGSLSTITGATGKELEKLTIQALKYARVNEVDVTTSVQTLGQLLNATETDMSEAGLVMDKLTKAAQDSGIGVNELAGHIMDAGPSFEEMGYGLDKSIALFADFTKMGAEPREIISSLDKVMNKFAEDGVKNADEAFIKLMKKIQAAPSQVAALKIANEAFGARVGGKVAEDIRSGAFEVDEYAASLSKAAGTVNKTSKETETFGEHLSRFRNKATLAFEPFGKEILTALEGSTDAIEPLLENVTDLATRFSELDTETQQSIIKFVALGTVAGPTVGALGRIGKGVADTGDGLAWLVRKVGGLQASAKEANPEIQGVGGTIEALGPIASTAGGSQGVGGLVTVIGTNLPLALGIAATAAGGWAVWKLWGEEAYEAGKRTRKWGTDVGEATDEVLTDIQQASREASGQFGLMEQGFDTDSKKMIGHFETMGQVIENSLVERIGKLDDIIKNLPETLEGTMGEILSEDKKLLEENLETLKQHNEEVLSIKNEASKQGRDITVAEAKMIQDLSKASAETYVKTLGLTKDEQEKILVAMTGDVEKASKDSATAWAKTLGEQRQELKLDQAERRKVMQQELEDTGIYSKARINELMEMWDDANAATTDGIDQQLAAIAEKYPEIADEILFSNGQMISAMSEGQESARASNEKIISSAQSLAEELGDSATKNAEQIGWLADESSRAGKVWNDVIFDPKTGEVKTNVREAVIEAGEDASTWNDMRFQLKEANLSSDAKSVIGEAAIVNGWWAGMAWEDKELVLQDDFSISIYEALDYSGKWNEMELEEQTAIMYSNTPEKMTETLMYLGLWDEYHAEVKEVNADNYSFLNTIQYSEDKLKEWDNLEPETKEMLAEDYDLMTKIFRSTESFNIFKAIPDEEKELLAENQDLLEKVTQSEQAYGRWEELPEKEKELIINNTEALFPIIESEEVYNRWLELPPSEKNLLADNTDLLTKILSSEKEFEDWQQLEFKEKKINAEYNTNVQAVMPGVERWNETIAITPEKTRSEAEMKTNAPTPTEQTKRWIEAQNDVFSTNTHALANTNSPIPTAQVNKWTDAQNKTKSTNTRASTSAPGIVGNTSYVRKWTGEVNRSPSNKKSVFTTIRETINKVFNRRTGDPHFPGGDVWLGDGGKREPYLTPDGHFGVSGNDWELHNLPRGTRIWPTKQSFRTAARMNDGLKQYLNQLPKFAKGGNIQNAYEGYTGLVGEAGPEIFQIAQGKVSITPITQGQRTEVLKNQSGVDMSNTNELLQTLIQLVAQGQVIQMDGEEVGEAVYPTIDSIMNNNLNRNKTMSMRGSD